MVSIDKIREIYNAVEKVGMAFPGVSELTKEQLASQAEQLFYIFGGKNLTSNEVTVTETATTKTVVFTVPGATKSDMSADFSKGVLTLVGKQSFGEANLTKEITKTVEVGSDFKVVSAKYHAGVLLVKLEKVNSSKIDIA